ncbi:MAG: SCP2 sterol-binding domain-containing protein [Actinomycetota bacterium]|nr:SCP2 sterol-binding domain-containing protein [Actinomycetota bacterium]
MAVQFLSEPWAQAVTEAINGSEEFRKAASGKRLKLQQVVTDAPQRGEVRYYLAIDNGSAQVALGEISDPDATLTQHYDTAVAISKQELSPTAAFMRGKVKISGAMTKLLALQPALAAVPSAVRNVDIAY